MALKGSLETFDPSNPEHRDVYRTYLQSGKLVKKFDPEFPRHTNMVNMMQAKLAAWAVEPHVSVDDVIVGTVLV